MQTLHEPVELDNGMGAAVKLHAVPEPSDFKAGELKDKGYPNIVFVAKMHAGKTTAKGLLTETVGYKSFAFADPLKQIANDLFPVQMAKDGRDVLQRFGMAAREIYEDCWLDLGINAASLINAQGSVWANDDCRFPNEAEGLQTLKCVFVRLECERGVRLDRLRASGRFQSEDQLEHPSETALDDFKCDYTIDNSHLNKIQLFDELVKIIDHERKVH